MLGNLGNMAGMLKMAQQMQTKMKKMNKKLEKTRVEGEAGGGMVVAVCNGLSEFKEIRIEPSVINAAEKELLESLVLAAINNARDKASELSKAEMEAAAGEMGVPPGMLSGDGMPGLGI